jgi:hypothetical protein
VTSLSSPTLLPIALPERPNARAFTIQYTTLILIIISFIVGSFGGRPAHPKGSLGNDQGRPARVSSPAVVQEAPVRREVEGRIPSDSIRIEHLFRPASVELDRAKAGAIAALLKAHDIDAEIDIVADSMGEEDYRIALRQARSLVTFLRDAGVPALVFRVFVVESKVPDWAAMETEDSTTVRLYRGAADGN